MLSRSYFHEKLLILLQIFPYFNSRKKTADEQTISLSVFHDRKVPFLTPGAGFGNIY